MPTKMEGRGRRHSTSIHTDNHDDSDLGLKIQPLRAAETLNPSTRNCLKPKPSFAPEGEGVRRRCRKATPRR